MYNRVLPLMEDYIQKGQFLFNLIDPTFKDDIFWNKNGDLLKDKLIYVVKQATKCENIQKKIKDLKIKLTDLDK